MIELKEYQNRVLDSLRQFLRLCSQTGNVATAFRDVTINEDTGESIPYEHVNVAGLSALPYVCLRAPTGGGKTLLACHSAGIAMTELLHADRAVVLWLVPSNTILTQTANALRDPRHPYRRALEMECGTVNVLRIDEALNLSRAAVDGETVVIVATIQSFRVEDKTGRRVYGENGMLMEHFIDVPVDRLAELDQRSDGSPIPSLANALKLRRPIVIVDEAHNARTDLSFATLASVSPSCIIEFTATPATKENRSNILHLVSAAELSQAEMIKLPLRVVTQEIGQKDQLLADSISLRSELEALAQIEGQTTREYIRPLLLIQAERVDACEPLRDRIASDFNVPREHIKISTGALDELKDIDDISSPDCPVRIIITVEKLREGWDCPFAYVLCSLKETRSPTALEQIVGRILRLPNAQWKQHPDLNCAYAFAVSQSITQVLKDLTNALEHNGFTKAEAERIILAVPRRLPLTVEPKTVTLDPTTEIDVVVAEQQSIGLTGKVQFEGATGGLTVLVPLSKEDEDTVKSWALTEEAKQKIVETVDFVRQVDLAFGNRSTHVASPYELRMEFFVPLLSLREGETLFPFDETPLLEREWKLSTKDASLEGYDPLNRPTGSAGQISVTDAGGVQATVLDEADFIGKLHQQVFEYGTEPDWKVEELVAWVDRQIKHRDFTFEESLEFVRKAIHGAMATSGIDDLTVLTLDRFRLRDFIEKRIDEHRRAERTAAFQSFLLPTSALAVDFAYGLDFRSMGYEPSWLYEGAFKFQKHYFGPKPGELKDGEEGDCAKFIDGLGEVEYWARNLQRKRSSFRLQTSKDWFYPDFICRLTDRRLLAVEYKGKYLYDTPDSDEKRAIGLAWEQRSDGRCLFVMPTEKNYSAVKAKIGDVPNPDEFRLS